MRGRPILQAARRLAGPALAELGPVEPELAEELGPALAERQSNCAAFLREAFGPPVLISEPRPTTDPGRRVQKIKRHGRVNDRALEVPARGGRNRPVVITTRLPRAGSNKNYSVQKFFRSSTRCERRLSPGLCLERNRESGPTLPCKVWGSSPSDVFRGIDPRRRSRVRHGRFGARRALTRSRSPVSGRSCAERRRTPERIRSLALA